MVEPGTLPVAPTVSGAQALGEAALRDAYQLMVMARATDERCLMLQRQGRIGFYAPLMGQEAAQVGASRALTPEDWVFPAYRELAVALARGVPLKAIFDQLLGMRTTRSRGARCRTTSAFAR